MKMTFLYRLATLMCCFHEIMLGVFSAEAVGVFVMDGDSVTLQTGVNTSQHERITWYFGDNCIARINGDLDKYCTDVRCNEDRDLKAKKERFRDRLKLDKKTGNLTIMNIRTADDTGDYYLIIYSNNSIDQEKNFSFTVDTFEKSLSVKVGESVTLDPGANTRDEMSWYFKDILIALVTVNQRQICTNADCKERFADRLKTENGLLNITNSRSTDSGEYKLMIHSSNFSIVRRFTVNVTDSTRTEENPAVIVYVLMAVAVVAAATVAAVILCRRHHSSSRQNETRTARRDVEVNSHDAAPRKPAHESATNGTSSNQANYTLLSAINGNR